MNSSSDRHSLANRCRTCGAPFLAVDDPDADYCGRPECLTRREVAEPGLVRLRQAREAEWLAVTQARTDPLIAAGKARLSGTKVDRIASGLVPFVDRRLTALPDARRTAFEVHLRDMIRSSFGSEPDIGSKTGADPEHRPPLESDDPDSPVQAAACMACRGDCCLAGAHRHAFISEGVIQAYRVSHPDATPEEVEAYYLDHLPKQHVTDSCVYHGETGCALPRERRSTICNSFLCWFRKEFDKACAESSAQGAVIVAVARGHVRDASEGAPLARVVTVSADGAATAQDDLTLPALPRPDAARFEKADAAVSRVPKGAGTG